MHPDRVQAALRQLEAVAPAFRTSPYVQRAQAWLAFLSGDRSRALEALARAEADPDHAAPELQGELAAMRRMFAGPAGP